MRNGWWRRASFQSGARREEGGMGPGPHRLSTASRRRSLGGGPHAWLHVALKTRPPDCVSPADILVQPGKDVPAPPRPALVNAREPHVVRSLSFPSPASSFWIFCDLRIQAPETRPVTARPAALFPRASARSAPTSGSHFQYGHLAVSVPGLPPQPRPHPAGCCFSPCRLSHS